MSKQKTHFADNTGDLAGTLPTGYLGQTINNGSFKPPVGSPATFNNLLLMQPAFLKMLPSFPFQDRRGKLNWRGLSTIPLEKVIDENDIRFLEGFLGNVIFCALDPEDTKKFVDPNLVKMFQLSQLSVEYLLQLQSFFGHQVGQLDAVYKDSQQKLGHLEDTAAKNKEHVRELAKEIESKKETLATYKKYFESHTLYRCDICNEKAFISQDFLNKHLKRRHPEEFGKKKKKTTKNIEKKLVDLEKKLEAKTTSEKAKDQVAYKTELQQENQKLEAKLNQEISELRKTNEALMRKIQDLESPKKDDTLTKLTQQIEQLSAKIAQIEKMPPTSSPTSQTQVVLQKEPPRSPQHELKKGAPQATRVSEKPRAQANWQWNAGPLEDDLDVSEPSSIRSSVKVQKPHSTIAELQEEIEEDFDTAIKKSAQPSPRPVSENGNAPTPVALKPPVKKPNEEKEKLMTVERNNELEERSKKFASVRETKYKSQIPLAESKQISERNDVSMTALIRQYQEIGSHKDLPTLQKQQLTDLHTKLTKQNDDLLAKVKDPKLRAMIEGLRKGGVVPVSTAVTENSVQEPQVKREFPQNMVDSRPLSQNGQPKAPVNEPKPNEATQVGYSRKPTPPGEKPPGPSPSAAQQAIGKPPVPQPERREEEKSARAPPPVSNRSIDSMRSPNAFIETLKGNKKKANINLGESEDLDDITKQSLENLVLPKHNHNHDADF